MTRPWQVFDVCPILPVADVAKAIEWYVGVMGWEERFRWGDPPSYGAVTFGGATLHLSGPGVGERPPGSAYHFLRGIDEYAAEIRARGAEFEYGPEDFEYGMREFAVRDPDGNRLLFGMGLHSEEE